MFKNIYDYFQWSLPKSIADSYEQEFYDANASLFNMETLPYNDNRSLFGIIRAVIVLRGLLNRKIMNDDVMMFLQDQLKNQAVITSICGNLPYFLHQGQPIYIPTYNPEINHFYANEPSVLKNKPYRLVLTDNKYAIVNPFETYHNEIYSSPFSSLIELSPKREDRRAYYHIQFETIFFVNKNGNLETSLPLFDEKSKKKKDGHDLFDHLDILAEDYYQGDEKKLLKDLLEYHFISKNTYKECLSEVKL